MRWQWRLSTPNQTQPCLVQEDEGLLVQLDERRAGRPPTSAAVAAQWFAQDLFEGAEDDDEDEQQADAPQPKRRKGAVSQPGAAHKARYAQVSDTCSYVHSRHTPCAALITGQWLIIDEIKLLLQSQRHRSGVACKRQRQRRAAMTMRTECRRPARRRQRAPARATAPAPSRCLLRRGALLPRSLRRTLSRLSRWRRATPTRMRRPMQTSVLRLRCNALGCNMMTRVSGKGAQTGDTCPREH